MDTCHACNISLCIVRDGGVIKEIIHSHIIGITLGITFFLFRFWHDSADCLTNFLIGKWCIVAIIVIDYRFQHLCIVCILRDVHACLFIRHAKSVQKRSTTFVYVKIARHFICNWIFLIPCLIICIFLFVYIFVNVFWFVVLRRTLLDDDGF